MKKIILLLSLTIPVAGLAQQYSVDWYKISGGGGTSTGGVYSVSGTIGQQDASGPMTGGSYSLTGGFWALISVVQTPGAPNLIITFAGPEHSQNLLAGHRQLHLAAEFQSGWRKLGHQRLHHHDPQRHEQHHGHAADGKPVFPFEQSVTRRKGQVHCF